MEVISRKIEEVIPYEKNPRRNEDAVEYVANSIREFGFKVPIIVDKSGVIIAGHTRLKAAQQLGLKEVPVVVADDLTDEQVKAFRIADNKVADQSSWDMSLLAGEIKELLDFDMTDFGFGDFELSILTEDYSPEPYDKEIEQEYSGKEQEYLARERIIITYPPEMLPEVLKLTGLENIDRVVYTIEELL